jgi:phosphoglycerate dehydrogenase-like enzyme
VLIASYLEPHLVDRIRGVDPRLAVTYEPALLRPPRYPADHTGGPLTRTADEEARWRRHLAEAAVLFDFDQTHREDLPDLAPNLRWVQATSAGIGQFVKRMAYDRRMPDTIFTTASGVHAQPLAEFAVMAMLAFAKGLPRMMRDQQRKHWERYAGTDLAGRAIGIVGVGKIGGEVARLAAALRMRVLGVKRRPEGIAPAALHLDELSGLDALGALLGRSEFLVLVTPHTDETEKLIGAAELARLPRGAVLINIGRGALVDEVALVESLRSGHLGGAALDVFAEEPLPEGHPLWELPNVLVTPHVSAVTTGFWRRECDLIVRNLGRHLSRAPLTTWENVVDKRAGY